MNTGRRISLREVAIRAGVSPSTVSRVLTSSSHPVNAATRARVRAAAAELDYYPDAMARSLKSRRSGIVGVVVHDISGPGAAEVVRGVEEIAGQSGYLVMVCSCTGQQEHEASYIRALRGVRADGIILAGTGLLDQDHQAQLAAQVGAVLSQGQAVVVMASHPLDVPRVQADQAGIGRVAASYLCRRGHRRIAVVAGPAHYRMTTERLAGFAGALAEAGVTFDPELVVYDEGGPIPDSGALAAEQLLQRGDLFTAVFVAGDGMEAGVLETLHQQGIRVPDEVSVIGVGAGAGVGRPGGPALTTVAVPLRQAGRRAMQTVLELVDPATSDEARADAMRRNEILEVTLEERGSVRSLAGLARRG